MQMLTLSECVLWVEAKNSVAFNLYGIKLEWVGTVNHNVLINWHKLAIIGNAQFRLQKVYIKIVVMQCARVTQKLASPNEIVLNQSTIIYAFSSLINEW